MNAHDVADEMRRLSGRVDEGIQALAAHSKALANAENAYRKAKAQAWVQCPTDEAGTKAGEREWTAARREAWVNGETADLRRDRDLADAMRSAALEAVRARRTQISALQTLLNADTEEAKFVRTEPR